MFNTIIQCILTKCYRVITHPLCRLLVEMLASKLFLAGLLWQQPLLKEYDLDFWACIASRVEKYWGEENQLTCYLQTSPVSGFWIEAGLDDISELWVAAISIIIVILYTVALHVTHSILSFPSVTGPLSKAVSTIMACSWMITLWVTSAVPNLLNLTVAENKLLPEAGVLLVVHTELKSDVVWTKSLG